MYVLFEQTFNCLQFMSKKQIQRELKDEKTLLVCAQNYGLVGDPTRMKICWLLCNHKELSVSQIADTLDVSVSVVSHSLRRLKERQLVVSRCEDRHTYYRFADTSFNRSLKQMIAAL